MRDTAPHAAGRAYSNWCARRWQRAIAATVVALVLGLPVRAPSAQQGTSGALLDDPLAKFAKLMPDVAHGRCMNCHGLTDPFTGAHHPRALTAEEVSNTPRLANGDMNNDVADFNKECRGCHDSTEPGMELWQLAPKRMSFVGKTAHEICTLWQESKQNSGFELLKHLNTDPLAKIAFIGNKGDNDETPDPPPDDRDKFLGFAKDWLAGQPDIPCAGWEGTITQTERVNLTTNYGIPQVAGLGVEEHTTEVQDATRTIEIAVNGSLAMRIAVQGTHRIDTTITIRQGAQSCTTTDNRLEEYGTTDGTTSAEARNATLTFSPSGDYSLRIVGPPERTRRVERLSKTQCFLGALPDEVETVDFETLPWTVDIQGVLPDPSDRTTLKGSRKETVMEDAKVWLTASGGRVTKMQRRDNGEDQPVPVEVTTTWDLHRMK
jgi:hypothetical protein